MDNIDRKILEYIQADGRASYGDIGAAIGLSVSAVNERLKKLERQGAICGWSALIDPAAAGCPVLAFVEVMVERPEHEAAFLAQVRDEPAILECHHVTGDWSYLLKVRVPDIAALETLLARRIKTLPGVPRSRSVVVLSSAKDSPVLPVAAEA